jgi:hypothetical protein
VRRGEHWQRIWDNVKCYWEHLWGTYQKPKEHRTKPIENLKHMRTDWEHDENTRIKKFHPHLKPFPLLAPPRKRNEPS